MAEATGSAAFAAEVFEKHIEGREPLDYARLLGAAGLDLRKVNPGKAWIGASQVQNDGDAVKLAEVSLRGSPLYAAGLEKDDEIKQCDGKAVRKPDDLENCVAKHSIGETLTISYNSRSGPKKVNVRLGEDPTLEVVTYEKAGKPISEEVRVFRALWLGSHAMRANQSGSVVN